MKAKSIWAAIFCIAACCCITSCNKATITNPTDAEEPDFYTVNLGWSGEIISITETPLTRAEESSDLYGIQVYSTPNKELAEGVNPTWTRYAYGLFDKSSDISIKLLKGYKYKFEATMIVDGKKRIQAEGNDKYYSPFNTSGDNSSTMSVTNSFDYQSSTYMSVKSSSVFIKSPYGIYNHPNVERFYGELSEYIPGMHGNKALIKMKRVCFGAKFIAKGKLAKEGTMEIQITDAPKMMIDLSTSEKMGSDYFTFSNIVKAYSDNNHNETIPVTINWHQTDGTIFPLGTHEITFKRNKMSTIQISIDTDNSDNELGLEIEDSEMTEDEDETIIQDGEIVDTDVDTNA